MSNLFFSVLRLSLMGSIVILCVILLSKIFRKNYSRQWLYIIWVVIAIRLIIPVNISVIDITGVLNLNRVVAVNHIMPANVVEDLNSVKPSNNLSAVNKQITADTIELEDNLNISDMVTQEKVKKENDITSNVFFSFSIGDIITAIWFVGAILFLFFHLGAYFNFRRKISRWSTIAKNNEVMEQFQSLCAELYIKRQINIRICSFIKTPILIGFIRPCIVLPSKDFTREQYYFILKHELIHYKHHDLFYKLILLCVASLHWFNPFIHYMVYLANNDMELYCDEKLVAKNNLLYRENYSKMLLQIITDVTTNNYLLLSAGIGGKNKQLKNRFFQIMNSKPTKKGTCFILCSLCLIIVIGNLIVWVVPAKTSNAEIISNEETTDIPISTPSLASENKRDDTSDELEEISNVLVIGIDGPTNNNDSRADSILVVSINSDTKKIFLTSFLRDMYLQIPEHGKGKLSSVYHLGGADLIKNTIETNFEMSINHTVTVNMEAFENMINSIGGIEVELSKKEADYLNSTNYISNKQYRNVTEGIQKLNGNQALGYIRVRKVPTAQGESDDIGRTTRLRSLLLSVMEECGKEDIGDLTKVLINVVPSVSTDLSLEQILVYLNTVLQGEINTNTFLVPAEGSYTTKVQDGMSIIDVDLDENIKVLKQIYK